MKAAEKLQKKIGWFLFELLVLGKVDDFHSGSSFQLHNRTDWEFYIEVSYFNSHAAAFIATHSQNFVQCSWLSL